MKKTVAKTKKNPKMTKEQEKKAIEWMFHPIEIPYVHAIVIKIALERACAACIDEGQDGGCKDCQVKDALADLSRTLEADAGKTKDVRKTPRAKK